MCLPHLMMRREEEEEKTNMALCANQADQMMLGLFIQLRIGSWPEHLNLTPSSSAQHMWAKYV